MRGDPSPVSIPGDGRGGVLILHGFTGTPYDVRPLAEYLGQQGWTVEAPLLYGHGGSFRDLLESDWNKWYATAEMALIGLRADVKGPVAIAGYSMGGLLALRLANQRPEDVAALSVLAAPLRLSYWRMEGIRLFNRYLPRWLLKTTWARVPKSGRIDCSQGGIHEDNPALSAFPLRTLHSLIDLGEVVRAGLPDVHQPALVVHGKQDHVVPVEASYEIVSRLGSQVVERLWLENSWHALFHDVDKDAVLAAVHDFFTRHVIRE